LGKPTAGAKLGIAEYGELNKWIHRPGQFTQFVNSIVPSAKPTLHFLHILLPHAPWEFLPSGKKYSMEPEIRGLVDNSNKHWDPFLWGGDRWAVAEAYQRHMLQVCLVDRLFGDLIDRLRSTDLYDQSLIIVVADHGCSFRINDSRRRPTPSNYPDILNVPFFLKLPYRNEGRIDDSNVETIDALPTIAEILKVRLPWKVDGISVLSPLPVRRNTKTFITEQGERRSFPATLDGRVEAIRYKFELFGRGSQVADLFKMGPHQELLGRNAEEVGPIEDSKSDLELDNPGYLSNYDSQASVTLTHVTGRIRRSSSEVIPQPLDLALAINGTIRAITKTYWSGREERFSAITPDWAYREGRNDVTGYAILRSKEGIRLARFHRLNGIPPYRWGDLIRLDRSGNSSLYLGDGWCHYSEGDFTWTDGKRASLGIDHDPVQGTVLLRVKLMPYWIRKSVEHQRIRILVNQRPVGEWMIDKPGIQEKNLVLPGEYFSRSARCMITFELPDAVSPASLGLGPDIRELGLAVYWISLAPEQLS